MSSSAWAMGIGRATEGTPPSAGELVEVGEDVFAYLQPDGSWFINNAGVVRCGDVLLHVDSAATVRRTQALLDATRQLGEPARRLLVVTHHHGDHTNGNATVAPELVIAQRNVAEELRTAILVPPAGVFTPVEWGTIEVREPDVLFDRSLALRLGGVEAEVHWAGRAAHTLGDSVVWLPAQRVLFAGDLVFVGGTPFALGGSVRGWLEALPWLRSFDAAVVVPGHGSLASPSDLDAVERYLRFVWRVAEDAQRAGVGPLEAARSVDLGEFGSWLDAERLVGNLHRALAELEGREVHVLEAFADMIAYNGGRPLTCHA